MGKRKGDKLAAICCIIGVLCLVLAQIIKGDAILFWVAALIAFVVALGFAGSAYARR